MREESIRKVLERDKEKRQEIAQEQMEEEYIKERERYISEYVNLIDGLLKECIVMQSCEGEDKLSGKGRLKYICVSYLRTGVETGTGEYLIRLHDDSYYHDVHEVEGRYTAEYRSKAWKADEEYFDKLIMSKFIRAKKYEVKDFLREYLFETYVMPMPEVIEDSLDRIKALDSYRKVKKDKKLALYYRELYGETERKILLYTEEQKG